MNHPRLLALLLWLGAGVLLLVAATADAQTLDRTLSLRADAWSGSRNLDDRGALARASAWGRATLKFGDAGRLLADGWVAAETRDTGAGHAGRVRELNWRLDTGPVTWTLGRQRVVWGRADGLNPTDQVSPRDFTLPVPEDDEQRRGRDGVQAALDVGAGTLSVLWFPRAASHTVPLNPPRGVDIAVDAPPHRPTTALRLDLAGDGWDGAITLLDGIDPLPDLLLNDRPGGAPLVLRNQGLRMLGADLSLARDGMVLRAEAAWLDSDARGPDDRRRKRPRLWLVAGAEWQLPASTTVGLQATLQHVRHWRSPDDVADPLQREVAWRQAALANQTAANQAGLVWRLARRWHHDTLAAEASGVVTGGPRSSLWRARLSWAIDDHWQLLAGGDLYTGPRHSVWGQFRDNRVAYVQLRRGL